MWTSAGRRLDVGWTPVGRFRRIIGRQPLRVGPILDVSWTSIGPPLDVDPAQALHRRRLEAVVPVGRGQKVAHPPIRPGPPGDQRGPARKLPAVDPLLGRVPPQVHHRGLSGPLAEDGGGDAGPPLVTHGVEAHLDPQLPTHPISPPKRPPSASTRTRGRLTTQGAGASFEVIGGGSRHGGECSTVSASPSRSLPTTRPAGASGPRATLDPT